MSKITSGIVLFSLLMALSLGVAFGEEVAATENENVTENATTENGTINATTENATIINATETKTVEATEVKA